VELGFELPPQLTGNQSQPKTPEHMTDFGPAPPAAEKQEARKHGGKFNRERFPDW
jgi:hypothetical protein